MHCLCTCSHQVRLEICLRVDAQIRHNRHNIAPHRLADDDPGSPTLQCCGASSSPPACPASTWPGPGHGAGVVRDLLYCTWSHL